MGGKYVNNDECQKGMLCGEHDVIIQTGEIKVMLQPVSREDCEGTKSVQWKPIRRYKSTVATNNQ